MTTEQLNILKESLDGDVSNILKHNNNLSILITIQLLIGFALVVTPMSILFYGLFILNLIMIHRSIIKLKWALITFKAGVQLFDCAGIDINSRPFIEAESEIEKAPISWSFLIKYL